MSENRRLNGEFTCRENREFSFNDMESEYLANAMREIRAKNDRKWDNGKLKYSLILPEFLEEMAKVLTLGELNHPPEADGSPSWQHVGEERYVDVMIRHLQSYRMGGRFDEDMGTHEMAHLAVNAMFIWWLSGVTK
jgi:hypothetical protein